MLQQTQVPRVIGKYKEFLKKFPTIRALAKAPLSDVLRAWSGLGYNRRAKYLHDAAKQLMLSSRGRVFIASDELLKLPGIGPYTAAAVRVFAFNKPDVLIETNIRAALIHHFFRGILKVRDSVVLAWAQEAADGQDPRKWHWALMDYGAYLKRSGVRNNHRSAHYTKQSKFEGSLRQMRGQILRDLMNGRKGRKGEKWEKALAGLARDGLIVKVSPRLIGPGPKKGKPARPGWRIA